MLWVKHISIFTVIFLSTMQVSAMLGDIESDLSDLQSIAERGNEPSQECISCQNSKKYLDLIQCPFLERRDDISILKKNWALDVSGSDLLRSHPAVINASADYKNNKLAIIDTGLLLKGNPSAGDNLLSCSPERDYSDHGTHVAGIAASKDYGVNPQVQLKIFPVKYRKENQGIGGSGFDHQDLVNQISSAADSDEVSVINISIESPEDPVVRAVVKRALDRGKWVVYGGDNLGSVNSRSSAQLKSFNEEDGQFAIGGYSSFVAPAPFSNFGSDLKLFAPAENIESLFSGYNTNLVKPQNSVSFSGTSMAAPNVAAILATMRAIAPAITSAQANLILQMTSIKRGDSPVMFQVNGFHAVDMVSHGSDCFDLDDRLLECLARVDKQIQDSLKMPKMPEKNSGCQSWESYYNQLRRGYFLTNGGEVYSQAILSFLDSLPHTTNWREQIYYASPIEVEERLDSDYVPAAERFKANVVYAQSFYRGDLKRVDQMSERESTLLAQKNLPRFLKLLPADIENVYIYLNYCASSLQKNDKNSEVCSTYLESASSAFNIKVMEKLVSGESLMSITPLYKISNLPKDDSQKLYRQGLKLYVLSWKQQADPDEFNNILQRIDQLDQDVRDQIVKDFQMLDSSGKLKISQNPWSYYSALSWATDDLIKVQEDELIDHFQPKNKDRSVAFFRYKSRRLEAGFASADEVISSLDSLFTSAKNSADLDAYQEYGGSGKFITYPLLKSLNDPKFANKLAKLLAQGDNLHLFDQIIDSGMVIYDKILLQLDKKSGEQFVALLTDAYKKDQIASASFGGRYIDLLLNHRDHPGVSSIFALLDNDQQTDIKLKKLRLEYLKHQFQNGNSMDQKVSSAKMYLREVAGGVDQHLTDIPTNIINSDEQLKKEWGRQLEKVHRGKKVSDGFVQELLYQSQDDLLIVSPKIAENFADLFRNAQNWKGYDAEALLYAMVSLEGANTERMSALGKELSDLLKDKKFMNSSRDNELLGGSVLKMIFQFAKSVEGKNYLDQHPELWAKMAEFVASQNLHQSKINFNTHILPEGFKKEMRERLPSIENLQNIEIPPRWIRDFIEQDQTSLDTALKYLKEINSIPAKDYYRGSIASLVNAHPALKEIVIKTSNDQKLIEMIK